jgi:hypothetical protein
MAEPTSSSFPDSIDNLPLYENGTGARSTITATTWNARRRSLRAAQNHAQQAVHVVGPADLKRITLSSDVTPSAGASFTTTFTLSAAQVALLGGQPFRLGNQYYADCYRLDATESLQTLIGFTSPNQVQVKVKRLDPAQTIAGSATYRVRLTIMGL